jgi:SWI/SNF-related matrix-associated actin-dependent regulator 1 of chromatin subfamily A
MILHFKDNLFICDSTYIEKDIPKQAGFWWHTLSGCQQKKCLACDNHIEKKWWTSDIDNALKLIQYADPECKTFLENKQNEMIQAKQESRAVNAEIEIPKPEDLEYMPFQKAGIKYCLDRNNVLIGDEMGLGKTIQALGLMNSLNCQVQNTLIICPASLKINWQREAEKWLVNDLRINIANSSKPILIDESDVLIVNYDILKKFENELKSQTWDLIIIDECQYIKNQKAIRTKQVKALRANRKLALTGTPILNRPAELFSILNYLEPNTWNNFWTYAKKYCGLVNNGYGWDFTGTTNLDELQNKLRSTLMIRRLKKDVLTELPDKRRQVIELPCNGAFNQVQKENDIFKNYQDTLIELKSRVELAKASENQEDYEIAIENLKKGATAAFTEISKIRHETALKKLPVAIDHIRETLDQVDKVVIFAHHKDVIAEIQKSFDNSVILTGDMNQDDRQKSVDRFNNDSNCKLFIGSIKAAGVGLTLTVSSHVIFVELDWTPAWISQCEDRTHRIGQKNNVLVQHLVLENSLDSVIAKRLIKKQQIIDQALDIDNPEKIAELNEPIIPTDSDFVSSKRASIAKEAQSITEDQKDAIMEGLKILAGFDTDRATSRNFAGFNKIDTRIGHELAKLSSLTNKQAALAKMVLKKYHRQLEQSLIDRM